MNDTDHDTILDITELALGTNASAADSDNDLLTDDSEQRLGTNPLIADSNSNGIPDGNETYTTIAADATLGVEVAITGTGDLAKDLTITNITSPAFVNMSFISSPLVDFRLNGSFESAEITLPYDPNVDDPANLTVFYFNETVRTFLPVASAVNLTSQTVSAEVDHFSTFTAGRSNTRELSSKDDMRQYLDIMISFPGCQALNQSDPDGYRKIAAKNFVDNLTGNQLDGDRVRIRYFWLYGAGGTDFYNVYSDLDTVKWYIDTLWSFTTEGHPWEYALQDWDFAYYGNPDHKWILILLTHGPGLSYDEDYVTHLKEYNITCYTIALMDQSNSTLLEHIASETGGEYYYAPDPESLPDIYQDIYEKCRPDTDSDGLEDALEQGGLVGGRFQQYHSTSDNADSDGDGLTDGEEAGQLITVDGYPIFEMWSDPSDADTDDDGLNDFDEFYWETDPFNSDTDGDGLLDGEDPSPLVPETTTSDPDLLKIGREMIAGAVFGEAGLPGGSCYWLVGEETASSPYYMVGWVGFSCVPAVGGMADVRDTVQAIINGDAIGAAMNVAGLIPGPGDGIKVVGSIACFTGKFPWKARELGVLFTKEIGPHIPDSLKIDVWNVLYDEAASRLISQQVTASHLEKVVNRGLDLSKVDHVTEVGDDVIPTLLEQIQHYEGRHVDGVVENGVKIDGTSLFPTSEQVTSYGIPYPGTSSLTPAQMKDKLREWADEAMRNDLTEWSTQKKKVKKIFTSEETQQYGISEIEVLIYGDIGVESIYPTKGPQIFKWYNNQWNPTM